MVTLGSEHHTLDFEAVWRKRMQVPENHNPFLGSREGAYKLVFWSWTGSILNPKHFVFIWDIMASG